MTLSHLVLREIRHRKASFALGVAAVAVAVFAFLSALALLHSFDRQTDGELAAMNAETDRLLQGHEDEIRKAMKGLGFNIHIYPESQDLSEIYTQGYGSATMPEEYVTTLANSPIVTVNHLLPRLTKMVEWPERDNRTVLLFGVRGEEPIAHRGPDQKKALIDPVADGQIVLGHELHRGSGWNEGDKISFQGREFEIAKLHARRGGIDDITAWISLTAAQEMLGKVGEINSILALECNCASLDRLGEIEAEIGKILPHIQIIEVESTALARAEARNQAKALRQKEMEEFTRGRDQLRETRASFAGILVALVACLSLAWIAYLTVVNVRDRMVEIGTFSAIGVRGGTLLGAFLARALIMGVLGTVAALAAFGLVGALRGTNAFTLASLGLWGWVAVVVAAPLLACAAAWLPALAGAQKDPAIVLRND